MDTAKLRLLANKILESLDDIDSITLGHLPDLDDPVASATDLRYYDNIQAAATTIKACCGQLSASVAPSSTLKDAYWGYILSACLKVVGTLNIPEILREAGPQGLHVRRVCDFSDTDPQKIARVLRLLASHHIFRELSPDVFTNNRLSSLLDSGCSVDELFPKSGPKPKRSDKFLGPEAALPALVEFSVDDCFVAATKLTEFLTEPAVAHSAEPTHAPLNLAFGMALPAMEWQQLPENELRRVRFDVAMSFTAKLEGPLHGFDWANMNPGSKVVDVGGGFGVLFINLINEYKHLSYIVQDQASVIPGATEFWKDCNPEALDSGRIQFQAIDFFKPQPLRDASLFILRQIIHDWSDPYAVKILRHLRDAAQPYTRLVIVDIEAPLACSDVPGATNEADALRKDFPAWVSRAPEPLLPNYGTGRSRAYFLDLLMMLFNNGQERTMFGHRQVLRDAGWEVDAVYYISESGNLQIVGKPLLDGAI